MARGSALRMGGKPSSAKSWPLKLALSRKDTGRVRRQPSGLGGATPSGSRTQPSCRGPAAMSRGETHARNGEKPARAAREVRPRLARGSRGLVDLEWKPSPSAGRCESRVGAPPVHDHTPGESPPSESTAERQGATSLRLSLGTDTGTHGRWTRLRCGPVPRQPLAGPPPAPWTSSLQTLVAHWWPTAKGIREEIW